MNTFTIDPRRLAEFGIITSDQIVSAQVLRQETLARRYSVDPEAREILKRCSSIVDTCLKINARACSMATLRLYRRAAAGGGPHARGSRRAVSKSVRRDMALGRHGMKAQAFIEEGGDFDEVMDHPILDFIRRPNPLFPGNQLEFASWYFRGAVGEYYSIITDDDQLGKLQWPGYPQFMQPVFGKAQMVEGYYFGRDQTSVVGLPPEQVLHYKNNLHRNNPLRGEGDLAGIIAEADLLQKSVLADIAFVDNGSRPDGLISINATTPLTTDQIKEVYDTLGQWKAGGAKEGMPLVGQGLTFTPMAWAAKDLRTEEQIARYERRVRFACGIPESMADSNGSTYAGSLVADAQHARIIHGKLIDDAAQKTEYVVPLFGLDPADWCFVYDSPVPREEEREWQMGTLAASNAMLTINEVRAMMGWDESDDPNAGKLLFNGQPLELLATPPVPPSPFGGFGLSPSPRTDPPAEPKGDNPEPEPDPDPTGKPALQVDPNDDDAGGEKSAPGATNPAAATPPASIVKAAMAHEAWGWTPGDCDCCGTKSTLDVEFPPSIARDLFDRYGSGFKADMEAILTDAQVEAINAAFAGKTDTSPELRDQARGLLMDQIERIAGDAIRAELTAAGAADDMFSVVNERALAFAERNVPVLVDDLFGTTGRIAQAAVERGIEEGMSIAEIQKEMVGVPEYRAEVIARTEVSRATNGARMEAFDDLGVEETDWLTAPGASAAHVEISKRSPKKLGEEYATAGEVIRGERIAQTVYAPPVRPNCRCAIVGRYKE